MHNTLGSYRNQLEEQWMILLQCQLFPTCWALVLSLNGVPDTSVTKYVATHSGHQLSAGGFKLLSSVHAHRACERGLSGWRGLRSLSRISVG